MASTLDLRKGARVLYRSPVADIWQEGVLVHGSTTGEEWLVKNPAVCRREAANALLTNGLAFVMRLLPLHPVNFGTSSAVCLRSSLRIAPDGMAHCQIEDLSSISILVAGATKHLFTFGWDDSGKCRWKRGVDYLHPWQVLKTALEPFFFDERYRFLLVG